jgi:hypothetical protein
MIDLAAQWWDVAQAVRSLLGAPDGAVLTEPARVPAAVAAHGAAILVGLPTDVKADGMPVTCEWPVHVILPTPVTEAAAGAALNTVAALITGLSCSDYSTEPVDLGGDTTLPAMTVTITTTTGC